MTDFAEDIDERLSVAVVIPNWNGMRWLPDCMHAVVSQSLPPNEIILVDNGSSDDSVAWTRLNYPQVSIFQFARNMGFAAAVNKGIIESNSDVVALLNTDTIADKNWLENLVKRIEDSAADVGAVSPLMLSLKRNELIDNAGDSFSWYGEALKIKHGENYNNSELNRDILSPSAGATAYRKSFFEDCGLFDEEFFAYLEDVDLGLRGRVMGYRFLLDPTALVYHHSHGSEINYNFYIRLVTQNRLLIFVKNIPFRKLIKFSPKILYGQFYYILAFGHLFASIKGYLGFLRVLPSTLRKRKKIQAKRRLTGDELEVLLLHSKPEFGIKYHLGKLRRKIINI